MRQCHKQQQHVVLLLQQQMLAADGLASSSTSRDTICAAAVAAADFSSAAPSAAAQHHTVNRRNQGELPRVPSMPARSLLMRKLVQFERLLRPPAAADDEHVLPPAVTAAMRSKQEARAARRAAADSYLSAVAAAAARHDIQALLQQLTAAGSTAAAPSQLAELLPAPPPPPGVAAAAAAAAAPKEQQRMPWLLPAALTLAARQLITGPGGKPEFGQALVELVLDQGIVEPQRAQRAVHAVLQAYYDRGDYAGVLAAASRFFDMQSSSSSTEASQPSSSSSKWVLRPSSVTLALLLDAAAAQGDAALLLGVWNHFGAGLMQTPQGASSSSKSGLPPAVVLHSLAHGAVMCDLWPASHTSGGSSSSQGSTAVSATLFERDSCTVDMLHQLWMFGSSGQQQQQHTADGMQQPRSRTPRQQHSSSDRWSTAQQQQQQQRLVLPVPLLHPFQASKLLQHCSSTTDIDLLLLSQLYQRQGLGPQDLVYLQRRLHDAAAAAAGSAADMLTDSDGEGEGSFNSSSSRSSALAVQQPQPPPPSWQSAVSLPLLGELSAVASVQRPAFPPPLRADVARAAVAAYLRVGAFGRAAAVAHAAALAHPKDIQQFHLLIQGAAAVGATLPGLVVVEKLRELLWQVPTPKAQAAMLRALARSGTGPPLGAAPSPARLISFFERHCTPHPDTWGALLQGLVLSGDRGVRLFKTLRVALAQPYSYMSLTRRSEQQIDWARSRVVAALLRGVLGAPEQGSRLGAVSAAASAILDGCSGSGGLLAGSSSNIINSSRGLARIDISSSSVSGSAGGGDLQPAPGSRLAASLGITPAAAQHAAAFNATALAHQPQHYPATSTSSSGRWLPAVQQAVPGLPLQQQPVHTRQQVVLLLQILQVLQAWGITIQHDAALAAALQVLRFCWDTEDARQSGLLVEVLRAALSLGMQPSQASLKALLACCADLESRPDKTPLGLAAGPGFKLDGVGYVDLGQVLAACREALSPVQDAADAEGADDAATGVQDGAAGAVEARRLAAQLLRTWVFDSTFDYVEGVRAQGPTWPLHKAGAGAAGSTPQLQQQQSQAQVGEA